MGQERKLEQDMVDAFVEMANKKECTLVDAFEICLKHFGYGVKNVKLLSTVKENDHGQPS